MIRMVSRLFLFCVFLLGGCGGGDSDGVSNSIPATSAAYVVVAWNDLGMHCLNPSYDTAVILPPYNTVLAQVIKRGNKPQVVTSGLTVSYRIINNSSSANKALFGQFWTNANALFQSLFPAMPDLALLTNKDIGLTDNGLSGSMKPVGTHFEVTGIPVVPIEDSGVNNPYQVAEITVKDSNGTVVAQTRATVPTSDEINCGKCHGQQGASVTQVFNDVLAKHYLSGYPRLDTQKPVLCASCHGSPALGTVGPGSSGKYLSQAIHAAHANRGAACYDCHPGASTKCNRSTKHTSADGNCTTCHGSMANVAATIASGARIPWQNEPSCVGSACHSGTIPQVDTGTSLYRNAVGHGGVHCAGCHGSPHAMVPSNQASDNYQALQYQAKAMVLGDCRNCHGSSRGDGGASKFASEHSGKNSACNICHTGYQNAGNSANWPHQFQWKSR